MPMELKYRPKVESNIMEATQSILLNKEAYGFFPDYDYAMQKSGYYTQCGRRVCTSFTMFRMRIIYDAPLIRFSRSRREVILYR